MTMLTHPSDPSGLSGRPDLQVLPSSRPRSRTWHVAPRQPSRPAPAPDDARVARRRAGAVRRVGTAWGPPVGDGLPDAARWSGWVAMALSEAFVGRRSTSQLVDHVSAEVLASLNRRRHLVGVDARLAPRTVLVSGRIQHPSARTAEATALLRLGPSLLVIAFRLEAVEGRWVCTALEVLPPLTREAA